MLINKRNYKNIAYKISTNNLDACCVVFQSPLKRLDSVLTRSQKFE